MITGARQGKPSGLRRLLAAAMARDLGTFVIPGTDIARAHGLDLEAAGLQPVASPRHASVLLVVGAIAPALCEAAAVVYAQMVRPRTLLVLGTEHLSPLPAADITAGLSQRNLIDAVRQLRRAVAEGAFRPDIADFDAPVLQVRIEYTCPMHPEVVQDEPGSCPKCGMNLVPREAQANSGHAHGEQKKTDTDTHAASTHGPATHPIEDHRAAIEYTCPMHPEVVQSEPGACPKCGMNLEPREIPAEPVHKHQHIAHETALEYTCPMHPEVVQSEPGSCPKCGMNLEPREIPAEPGHEHRHTGHETVLEYTCPMHPEVVQDEPGSCPKCGMNLEPREIPAEPEHQHQHMTHEAALEYTCPMHPEVVQSEPGACPKCGMNLEPREIPAEPEHQHQPMAHEAVLEYTCPMHPEVVQSEPGSCPKCGMNLEPREIHNHEHGDENSAGKHAGMDHSTMDHDAMAFMSMIEVTRDLPRSSDGLPMEWIDAPFGPFFPGLPGGLLLMLTLDGDTVAGARARALTENGDLLHSSPMDAPRFVERLSSMDPLAPVAYGLLACQALENAAGVNVPADMACARAAALERERISSHLGWLALFGQQTGFGWLMQRAASLQLAFLHADSEQIVALKPAIHALIKRLQRTPLLKSRTAGIGRLTADSALYGPVARATGVGDDTRKVDGIFTMLGFTVATRKEGDVLARLQVRLDEMIHSLSLIEAVGAMAVPAPSPVDDISANGMAMAVVETPRGAARLQVTLEKGRVTAAQLETPSTSHLALVEALTAQQALGDALTAVVSLDLSPWEVRQ